MKGNMYNHIIKYVTYEATIFITKVEMIMGEIFCLDELAARF